MTALVALLIPGLLLAQSAPAPHSAPLPRILPVPEHARPTPPGLQAAPAVSGSDNEEKPPRRWQRRAVWLSAGIAVTGAAVAYWSTREADRAYDRYLRSAGPGRQQMALDDAENHDRLAGAGFLVMEAGLVLTTRYLFF